MRFRAEQRLRRQLDFRAARERGRRVDCGGFALWYLKRPLEAAAPPTESNSVRTKTDFRDSTELPRVGVVASTASVGNAIRRNRAKRRLREIFRRHQALVPAHTDLLLVARHAINRLEFAELERKFVEVCQRLFSSAP